MCEKIKVYVEVFRLQDIYVLKTETVYINDEPILMEKEEFDKYQRIFIQWEKAHEELKLLIEKERSNIDL